MSAIRVILIGSNPVYQPVDLADDSDYYFEIFKISLFLETFQETFCKQRKIVSKMGCKQSKKPKPEMPREPDLQLEFDQSDSFVEISDDERVIQMPEEESTQNLTPKL